MNIDKVEAYTDAGKRLDTAHVIDKLNGGLWRAIFVDFPEAGIVHYCIAYDAEGRAERVPISPIHVPVGECLEVMISAVSPQMVLMTPPPPRVDPSDLLERLRGNGRPWSFAEIIEEISRLRQMRLDVLHYANCLHAAHVAGPPEYDFDDEKEFLACILKAVV